MSIEEQIQNLKIQEANLKKAAKDLEIKELRDFAESLKGRYFKKISQAVTNQNRWSNIEYITFGSVKNVEPDSDYLNIETSRHIVSWHNPTLYVNSWNKEIGFMSGNHKFTLPKNQHEYYRTLFCKGTDYDKYKTGYVLIGYEEVTGEEFMGFLQDYCDFHNNISSKFSKYTGKIPVTGLLELDFNEMSKFVEIEKLLKSGYTLPEVKKTYMAQVLNLFSKNEITELCQYDTQGNKILKLRIEGGDDGTDYEPYITNYYIYKVEINWAELLYPIRLKLNCKVMELVKKLENFQPVYNTDNWDVSYSGSYDVTFNHARLNQNTLNKLNQFISPYICLT